jgi:hypothetical protein
MRRPDCRPRVWFWPRCTCATAVCALVLTSGLPAAAQPPLRLRAGIGVSTAYDSNLDHRFDGAGAASVTGTGDVELRLAGRRTDIRFAYALQRQHYEMEPARDRTAHDIRLSLNYSPSRRYALSTTVESLIGGLSEDQEVGTQHALNPRLDIQLNERNRLRLRSMHRLRHYGERSGRDAVNHGAGVAYRVGASRQPTLELSTRFDRTHTSDLRSQSSRWTHGATFATPLGANAALELSARQTTRVYPHRHIGLEPISELDLLPEERRILEFYSDAGQPTGTIPFDRIPDEELLRWRDLPRRDEIWAPRIALNVRTGAVELLIAYDLESRLSNDLRRGYIAHTIGLGSRWAIR